jgi:hypothetical protein
LARGFNRLQVVDGPLRCPALGVEFADLLRQLRSAFSSFFDLRSGAAASSFPSTPTPVLELLAQFGRLSIKGLAGGKSRIATGSKINDHSNRPRLAVSSRSKNPRSSKCFNVSGDFRPTFTFERSKYQMRSVGFPW